MKKDLKNKIVFVADIDNDIDDAIAIEYLQRNGFLKCAVLDGMSNNEEREKKLLDLGVVFKKEIPPDTSIVFCGGALTKVAEFVKNNILYILVANGGFAGADVVPVEHQLDKFKKKTRIRTYNFNMDVDATESVLHSSDILIQLFVSKNVCHSDINVKGQIHTDAFLDTYPIDNTKRLHDLLMVKEGIEFCRHFLNISEAEEMNTICSYTKVTMVCDRQIPGNMSRWGCVPNEDSNILISTSFK